MRWNHRSSSVRLEECVGCAQPELFVCPVAVGASGRKTRFESACHVVASSGQVCFLSSEQRGEALSRIVDPDEPTRPVEIVGAAWARQAGGLVVATRRGDLFVDDMCVGSVDSGIEAFAFSPDESVIAIVSGRQTLLLFSKDWDLLLEESLASDGVDAVRTDTAATARQPSPGTGSAKTCISWRGDGQYLVVQLPHRPLLVYDRNLVCISQGEATASRGTVPGTASWRPDGSVIAVAQHWQEPLETRIAFVEKNGLLHYYFTLVAGSHAPVTQTAWNRNGDVLAVVTGCSVLLWHRQNYQWDLKQALDFSLPGGGGSGADGGHCFPHCCWETADGENSYMFHVGTMRPSIGALEYHRLALHWTVCSSHTLPDACLPPSFPASSSAATPQDDCWIGVVNGSRVRWSCLGRAVVPPPMSQCESLYGTRVAALVPLDLAPFAAFLVVQNDGRVLMQQFHGLGAAPPLPVDGLQLAPDDILAGASLVGGVAVQCRVISSMGRKLLTYTLAMHPDRISVCESPSCFEAPPAAGCWVQTAGSLALTSVNAVFDADRQSLVRRLSCEADQCCDMLACFDDGQGSEGSLVHSVAMDSRRGALFLDGECICRDASSYTIHDRWLLYTQISGSVLHLIPWQGSQSSSSSSSVLPSSPLAEGRAERRDVELGATLVCAAWGGSKVVLQMPRGNLETIQPRCLILDSIGRLISSRRYAEALAVARKHKIAMDLLVDGGGGPESLVNSPGLIDTVAVPVVVRQLLASPEKHGLSLHLGKELLILFISQCKLNTISSTNRFLAVIREAVMSLADDLSMAASVAAAADEDSSGRNDHGNVGVDTSAKGGCRHPSSSPSHVYPLSSFSFVCLPAVLTTFVCESPPALPAALEFLCRAAFGARKGELHLVLASYKNLPGITEAQALPDDESGDDGNDETLLEAEANIAGRSSLFTRGSVAAAAAAAAGPSSTDISDPVGQMRAVFEAGIMHLRLYVGIDKLFDAALGMYDFDLVYEIGRYTQKDPREYIPLVEGFEKIVPASLQRCEVDCYLERFESAVVHLVLDPDVTANPALLSKLKLLLTNQTAQLLPLAFAHVPSGDRALFSFVALMYGQFMQTSSCSAKFSAADAVQSSFLLSTAGSLASVPAAASVFNDRMQELPLDAVLKGWVMAGQWKDVCAMTSDPDILRRCGDALVASQKPAEAMEVFSIYCGDAERALEIGVGAGLWDGAEALCVRSRRFDMMTTHVKPALRSAVDALFDQGLLWTEVFQSSLAKLRAWRAAWDAKSAPGVGSSGADDDMEELDRHAQAADDAFSDAASTMSRSSHASRSSRTSSSSRRLAKKYSKRAGPEFEEEHLIRQLRGIMPTAGHQTRLSQILRAIARAASPWSLAWNHTDAAVQKNRSAHAEASRSEWITCGQRLQKQWQRYEGLVSAATDDLKQPLRPVLPGSAGFRIAGDESLKFQADELNNTHLLVGTVQWKLVVFEHADE